MRGYSTALIEREDFSAGASAHCFKVVQRGAGDTTPERAGKLEFVRKFDVATTADRMLFWVGFEALP